MNIRRMSCIPEEERGSRWRGCCAPLPCGCYELSQWQGQRRMIILIWGMVMGSCWISSKTGYTWEERMG